MARADMQFRLRLPQELHAQVADRAKCNLRTMNSEIVMILANALGGQGKPAERDVSATACNGMPLKRAEISGGGDNA